MANLEFQLTIAELFEEDEYNLDLFKYDPDYELEEDEDELSVEISRVT